MPRIKIAELQQRENQLFLELSEYESSLIVGGLNPQPLPPIVAVARQPELERIGINIGPGIGQGNSAGK